jgi:radical SAM protein with 4Fe4S-binding SPASM domain
MIVLTMKPAQRRLQEGFLEVVKWVRRLCSRQPVRLLVHPADAPGLGKLRDVEILPILTAPFPHRHQLPGPISMQISTMSPGLILWGPEPTDKALMEPFDGSPSWMGFSTHLRFPAGNEDQNRGSIFTLIHGDPKPRDPWLNPPIDRSHDRIFTGFITVGQAKTDTIWPIHTRGAEITANFVKNILSGRPSVPNPYLYPIIAMVEPTRRCNLSCPMCPVGSNRTYRAQDMPLGRFRKIVDELKSFLIHLTLHNYGESFLHRDIYEMIAYAKAEGIPDVNVSSNGHFLNASRLVDSGLDEIMISLDGITQETYATYRRGGKLEYVVENIRSLVEEKKRRLTQKPLVELQFIIMKHNQEQIDGFRKLAVELGVDRVRFKTFNLQMSGPEACETGVEFLPTHVEYSRYQDDRGRILKRNFAENRCKWPWERVVINSDGHVVPCCYDFNSRYSMGNVFEQSFHEVWFGAKYNRFRKRMLERWRRIPLCTDCPAPGSDDLSFERLETPQR